MDSASSAQENRSLDIALSCLAAVARFHRIPTTIEQIRRDHLPSSGEEFSPKEQVLSAASSLGLRARATKVSLEDFTRLKGALPAIALLKNGNFIVVLGFKEGEAGVTVAILDPIAQPSNVIFSVPQAEFSEAWQGEIILIKRDYAFLSEDQPFGLRWFLPELARQRQFLRDVATSAILLHLLALALPIFLQLVIDKVIVHQGYSTLYVLTAGVMLALVFEALFSFFRQYFLLHVTNRIDIRLAQKTFAHLLRLPIGFFETGATGVITRDMQQAEKIRQFLTGRLFLTMLDASILVVLVPVLFFYSPRLAIIVLAFTAAIGAVVAALIPTFRARLKALYAAEAERQAMLVESIQGMRTIKSLAVEPQRRREWEERAAVAVGMHFRVGKISITAHTAMSLLEKLMSVSVIAVGAHAVFDQVLSVGSLVAFQMLAGRVASPLVQVVSLVHEYQETAESVGMLGRIMNSPVEGLRESGGMEPELAGNIEFEDVTFRYNVNTRPALNQIRFNISAGKVVGVVGRSGSGKTTLTRLIQGLYPPQEGLIRFDGVDIREIDLAHLRRQIGVVLQDSFLFRGTVRENLSITRPSASLDEVKIVAEIAGATEFIEGLPKGYDTLLDENGSNLSGGQRQRLAIARALLTQPKILIFDEAASALDPESEAIFLNNLERISSGRTVIMISHRLATLVSADEILVMDQGRMVCRGSHVYLLSHCGIYANLWRQQNRHL